MNSCHQCAAAERFDRTTARRDLRRFRRRGPDGSTRSLLSAVQAASLPPRPSLLDIGGGIGAIHHFLLDHGFENATHVDASDSYLAAAAEEAQRRGHEGKVRFLFAAFPDDAPDVPQADVVTLDRVVCCDPDYVRLLGAAARRSRCALAFSYPHPRWIVRAYVTVHNLIRRIQKRRFRTFVHPPDRMKAVLESAGMRSAWVGGTWIWAVELFERVT